MRSIEKVENISESNICTAIFCNLSSAKKIFSDTFPRAASVRQVLDAGIDMAFVKGDELRGQESIYLYDHILQLLFCQG